MAKAKKRGERAFTSEDEVTIGMRVKLSEHHPWMGEEGTVVRFETWKGRRSWVVVLDKDGADLHCGVVELRHMVAI